MLSRAAANLYWFGRYLQRAENTARLVNVNALLLLDLPKTMTFGWQPLIDIFDAQTDFSKLHDNASEANVVRFLLTDERNPGSVFSSLIHAREILRSTRDTMPRDAWERLNDVYLYMLANGEKSASRRHREAFLNTVIDGSLLVSGILIANMSRDVGFQFLRIGNNLEQADMTTRMIASRSANLIQTPSAELAPFDNIQWLSVLRSLTAYHMYRRQVRTRVAGAQVLKFLLQDRYFPRSVTFCLRRIENTLPRLPASRPVERALTRTRALVKDAGIEALLKAGLAEFMDEIQKGLADFHEALAAAYFRVE